MLKVGDLIYEGMPGIRWHKDDEQKYCCPLCGDILIDQRVFTYTCGFSGFWEQDVLTALRIKTMCRRFVPYFAVFPEKFDFLSK